MSAISFATLFAQQEQDGPKLIVACCCNLGISVLFGLIPYYVGRHREQELLGYLGCACCVVGGFLLTFVAAILSAIVFVVLIFVFTSIPTDLGADDGPRRRRRPKPKPQPKYTPRFRPVDSEEDQDDRPRDLRSDDKDEGIVRLPELREDDPPRRRRGEDPPEEQRLDELPPYPKDRDEDD